MTTAYALGPGDGLGADSLDCYDDAGIKVLSWDAPPPEDGAKTRTVTVRLKISAATADALWGTVSSINAMLDRAKKTASVYRMGQGVTFSMRPLGVSSWTYLDVLRGTLSIDQRHPRGLSLFATVTLTCLRYGRGDAVTLTATSTMTNGSMTWLVENILGDAPALARLTIEDVSTNGQIINGIHVYQRSGLGLEAGDFDPVIEMTAATPGVATSGDGSSYSSSNFARLSANPTWRTIAEATRPSGAYNDGLIDLWLRVRDSSAVPGVPQNLEAEVTSGVVVSQAAYQSDSGSATTIAVSTNFELTSDHLVVLAVACGSRTTTITSITSIGGQSWTLASDGSDDARVVHGSGAVQVSLYWLRPSSTVPAGTTVTVTFSGAVGSRFLSIAALTNMATTTPIDQVAADATTTTGTSVAPTLTTSAQAYEVLLTAGSRAGGFSNSPSTPGFTNIVSHFGTPYGFFSYRSVAATGAYTATTSQSSNRDWVGTLVAFKAASATPVSLTPGTWNLRMVAVGPGGELSPVTDVVQVTVNNTSDSITLNWDAPASGTVVSYRAMRDRGTGWGWFDTGSTATTYTWTTESGITNEDPDIDGDAIGLFRVQVALANGLVLFTGPTFTAPLTGGVWCDAFAGTFHLPPIPALDGADPPAWLIRVQGRHPDANPNLDVDVAWMAPHDEPQLLARFTGASLATKRDWVLDQRRDGRISGRLYVDGTTTDAGQVDTIGGLYIGPDNTQVALRLTGAGGSSDVDDLKAIATLRYIPRYLYLKGA